MKIDILLRRAYEILKSKKFGYANHQLESEILLAHVLNVTREWLLSNKNYSAAKPDIAKFNSLVDRRLGGEPIAYLIGYKEFWSLQFTVNSDVLIPRADSELLVELSIAHINKIDKKHRPIRILELGTGSGAIAIALAYELPHCEIIATDISPAALCIAKQNAKLHNTGQIKFICGNWFEVFSCKGEVDMHRQKKLDLIVANPPYITAADQHLAGEIKFEPSCALVSAGDGLYDLTQITQHAPAHLNPNGMLLVEHGYTQAAAVQTMFKKHDFININTQRDLGGHPRCTSGQISAGIQPYPNRVI